MPVPLAGSLTRAEMHSQSLQSSLKYLNTNLLDHSRMATNSIEKTPPTIQTARISGTIVSSAWLTMYSHRPGGKAALRSDILLEILVRVGRA